MRRQFATNLPLHSAIWLAATAALLLPLNAFAHDDPGQPHSHAHKFADKDAFRPTPIPDRILLTWKGDPTTTQAVTWRTDTSVERGVAEITEADDGPFFEDRATRFAAETVALNTDLGEAHYHSIDFRGLKPKTLYVYRVGDGTNWSPWIHFRTASPEPEPFSFIYFGDAQVDIRSHWSRVFREAFSDAPRAKFMLHAGDLVNSRPESDAEWGEWCEAGGWVNAMIPTIAIPGNHEYVKAEKGRDEKLVDHWRPVFEYPENGPKGLEETVYYVDFQGVRIIGLNSNEGIQDQIPWLEKALSENPNRWTIVTHHHPIYNARPGRDLPEIRNGWQPLYDKYRVDIVLQGHDHSYGRTGMMAYEVENVAEGVNVRSEEAGTVYVISVSGPKMHDANKFPFVRRASDTQLYQIITVDGDEMHYEARTARGTLYDAFTLRKRRGEVNELIEQVPDVPERRPAETPQEEAAAAN